MELTIEELIRNPFKDLAIQDEPVQTVCGCRVVEGNALELCEGGFICFDCFSEDKTLILCKQCNLVLSLADLVKFRECPACGSSLEGEK